MKLIGILFIIVFMFLVAEASAVNLRNQNYYPKIYGRNGNLEYVNLLDDFSKVSVNFAALPYSSNSGGKIMITAYSEGKKISVSLNLKDSVVTDTKDMIEVTASGAGSWFNGKKTIRGIDTEVTYTCDRRFMTIDVEAVGDIDFKVSNIETNYCGY